MGCPCSLEGGRAEETPDELGRGAGLQLARIRVGLILQLCDLCRSGGSTVLLGHAGAMATPRRCARAVDYTLRALPRLHDGADECRRTVVNMNARCCSLFLFLNIITQKKSVSGFCCLPKQPTAHEFKVLDSGRLRRTRSCSERLLPRGLGAPSSSMLPQVDHSAYHGMWGTCAWQKKGQHTAEKSAHHVKKYL